MNDQLVISTKVDKDVYDYIEQNKGRYGSRSVMVSKILSDFIKQKQNASAIGERIIVFMDVKNVEAPVRNADQFVDYSSLLAQLSMGRDIVDAMAFDGKEPTNENNKFHQYLASCGWKLDLRAVDASKHQKEVDMSMGVALISRAIRDEYDTAIVVSGDRDFVPAIEYVKSLGKRVEVVSHKVNISESMIHVADSVAYLDNLFIMEMGA